ncbi:hypothetical protein BH11PSE11_BH11PSE11_29780 [soil metagenome]
MLNIRTGRLALALLLSLGLTPLSLAQTVEVEPRIKAAFVYNLLKFVEWPAQAVGGPVTICLAHSDSALESAFNALNGRVANGRTVVVRALPEAAGPGACNVVYLNNGSVKKILNQLVTEEGNLLTISDARNFIAAGGVVGMLVGDDGRLQFEVNLEASRRASYLISSQLLKLARNIH